MKKPKALIVASVASMIQQFNMPNIKILINLGYDVEVACNFIDSGTIPSTKTKELMDELDSLKVMYHQIDFDRNAFNIYKNYKAYRQMKKIMINRYDLVHSHSPIGGVLARITASKYRKDGLKSIYTAHGFHFYEGSPKKMWIFFYPIEKLMSRITDVLITINKEDYEIAQKRLKAFSTIYIPGVGIDTKRFMPISFTEKKLLKESYGYSKEDFIIVYVGELSHRKNQIMLLNSLNIIKKKIKGVKLLLVGTGKLDEEYKEFVKRNQLEKNVEFLGYREDIPNLMSISNIAVSTSKQEGLPVNVMEAMSVGIPLVLTNCRGNRDLIIDGRNGYLVEVGDTENFANKIMFLYKNALLRDKMGKNNIYDIEEYSLEKITEYIKKIYKR